MNELKCKSCNDNDPTPMNCIDCPVLDVQPKTEAAPLAVDLFVRVTPLEEATDLEWLKNTVEHLYQLLDDIDTMDDVARDRDTYYRNCVSEIQKKKTDTGITTDGYKIYVP